MAPDDGYRKGSLPMRERGLKFLNAIAVLIRAVAPHAGAWIEIDFTQPGRKSRSVAPHAGAWIEICQVSTFRLRNVVAPPAGAWIEI